MNRFMIKVVAVALLSLFALNTPTQAAIFAPLGGVPNEGSPSFKSQAYAISADGRVVVGTSGSGPFKWTEQGGMILLGVDMEPSAVSADGSVIVGSIYNDPRSTNFPWSGAVRWTTDAGLVPLGPYSDEASAQDVSADGTVVVGYAGLTPTRWTEATGWIAVSSSWGLSSAVSADGAVVVGWVVTFQKSPFRWSSASGPEILLGDPEYHYATATGISADGSVVIGAHHNQTPGIEYPTPLSWRWTEAAGHELLHTLSGDERFYSTPADTSADGTVVVGSIETESGSAAFYWTQANGLQVLADLLVTNGATGLDGWTLEAATGISDDGKTIAGWGSNPEGDVEAWVARPFGRFDDVPPDHWAFSAVEKVAESCITSGCGNGNYCPDAVVTRSQMAVLIERAMRGGCGYTVPPPASGFFVDVPPDHWAGNWIEQLSQDCITAGCGGGKYCPDAPVNRDQMAVFLERAINGGCGYPLPLPATGIFADVPPDHWAADWIEQLSRDGITAGCGNGNFCPEDAVTRAQMAVFLARAFGL